MYAFDKKTFESYIKNNVYDDTVNLIIDPLCFPNPCHIIRNIIHNSNIYEMNTILLSLLIK